MFLWPDSSLTVFLTPYVSVENAEYILKNLSEEELKKLTENQRTTLLARLNGSWLDTSGDSIEIIPEPYTNSKKEDEIQFQKCLSHLLETNPARLQELIGAKN